MTAPRDPYLLISRAAMQYRMPSRPLPCPACGYLQVWRLDLCRYLTTPPVLTGPVLGDPTALPDRPEEPPASAVWHPPPGWGHVHCRLCAAHNVLILRQMPAIGILNPPALLEIQRMRLSYSTVQYRLTDHPTSGEERWRYATVTRQHSKQVLDLAVRLNPDDPEHHALLLSTLRLVEVRLEDLEGEERWRPALVTGRPGDGGALTLMLAYDSTDPEARKRGLDRKIQAIRGDAPGQWRYAEPGRPVEQNIARAETGQRHGQWLPITNS